MPDPFKMLEEPIQALNDPKLIALKNKRREELREEFFHRKLNPHLYIKNREGTIFDPSVQRYISTLAHMEDYFKAKPKLVFSFIGWVIAPMIGIAYMLKWDKENQELNYRTGQVAYADRHWKFA